MDINDRIIAIMNEAGLNQASFARLTGIGDMTVRQVTAAKRNKPGFDFLAKVAVAFPWLNVRWMLTGEGEMKSSESETVAESKVMPTTEPQLMEYLKEKDCRIEELVAQAAIWKMRFIELSNRQ